MALDRHREAVAAVYVRYCDIVDDKAFDRLDEVFTADTIGDYRQAYGPDAVRTGLAELIALFHRNLGPGSNCGATHHNVGNFAIEIDGDRAHARVNYHAVHRGVRDHAGALYAMWGRYDDILVRTAAGWRIAERRYRTDLTQGPVVTSAPGD